MVGWAAASALVHTYLSRFDQTEIQGPEYKVQSLGKIEKWSTWSFHIS